MPYLDGSGTGRAGRDKLTQTPRGEGDIMVKIIRVDVWKEAGCLKWFIEYDGLMDVDAGYFETEEEAWKEAYKTMGYSYK